MISWSNDLDHLPIPAWNMILRDIEWDPQVHLKNITMIEGKSLFILMPFYSKQGSDRIDSFWFAEMNQKSQKDFDSRGVSKSFFFDTILIFIHFDMRFNLILFILIRFDFDSSPITIHLQIMAHLRIQNKN